MEDESSVLVGEMGKAEVVNEGGFKEKEPNDSTAEVSDNENPEALDNPETSNGLAGSNDKHEGKKEGKKLTFILLAVFGLLVILGAGYGLSKTDLFSSSKNSDLAADNSQSEKVTNTNQDVDGDGLLNQDDPDIDGDGLLNSEDPDVDGDGVPNGEDPDIDGDGLSNGQDSDADSDGLPNSVDADVDGDGIANSDDLDLDGDGLDNDNDPDADGDGVENANDESSNGFVADVENPDIDGDGILNAADDDVDGDGVLNKDDLDIDGDGITNAGDVDVDGDGLLNSEDLDIDGDGVANSTDSDTDGDGVENALDSDIDGDGLTNSVDDDVDSDGLVNSEDDDIDGDGILNSEDPSSSGVNLTNAQPSLTNNGEANSSKAGNKDIRDSDGTKENISSSEVNAGKTQTSIETGAAVIKSSSEENISDASSESKAAQSGILSTPTGEVYFFKKGSFYVNITEPRLNKILSELRSNLSIKLLLTGHADTYGSSELNLNLSVARAEAVKAFFISEGVSGNRIEIEGKGEMDPKFPNDTEENRAKNRRVEYKLTGN